MHRKNPLTLTMGGQQKRLNPLTHLFSFTYVASLQWGVSKNAKRV